MTIRLNPELATILNGETSQYAQVRALDAALTANKRIKARRVANASTPQADVWATGTLFRDAALLGAMGFNGVNITSYGVTSDMITCLAADLTTGKSVLRIEGGGHWIEGTLGLEGSGADFTLPANPTTSNSLAISSTLNLAANHALPEGIPDLNAPTITLAEQAATVTDAGSFALTATATDNIAVTKVEFYRNDVKIGERTSAPWTFVQSLSMLDNGTIKYTAKAFDGSGNSTLSTARYVTVNIAAPTETGTEIPVGSVITTMTLENTAAASATNVPVTFGQVFAVSNLPASSAAVEMRAADNSVIPAQIDVKATHPDGSVRHALISAIIPSMTASESRALSIVRKTYAGASAPITSAAAIAAGLDALVSVTDAGVAYTASLASLLASAALESWASGSIATEWLLSGPLKSAGNVEHPYLHARFAVRMYAGMARAKVDVCIENSWVIPDPASVSGGNAWVNNSPPHSITYDMAITVAGDPGYSQLGLIHYNKARVIKTFWWNGAPSINVKHNPAYVISTKAVPNYDLSIASTARVAAYKTKFDANNAPMKAGVMEPGQGNAGSRADIGLNPGWCVIWLLTGDKTAREISIGTSHLAGSFPVHYRNKATGRWLDIREYPYACLSIGSSSDDLNPATGRHEKIHAPTGTIPNPNVPNGYHQPNMSHIPYLLTGDFFHLEEMQAWTEWDVIQLNPGFRFQGQGIVKQGEPRYRAWLVRTVADTAYISPDGDPIKVRATAAINATLDYFVSRHITSPVGDSGNPFGLMHDPAGGCNALLYKNLGHAGTITNVGAASYQADHITCAIGRCVELGFSKAQPLLNWMANNQVGRLTNPDYCWVMGSRYALDYRATSTDPFYTSWAQIYEATVPAAIRATACGSQAMADAISVEYGITYVPGQMPPYSSNDLDGYCNILQASTAYIQMSNHPKKGDAWLVIDSRAAKPVFAEPVFAILPR